ncbi:GGDEF domain-containing protein [Maridesulfovibrio zosterae]|uniref:GGDEF domain-containing protein n=1 Tax=Maridesulfovibrio zosterae TaxID=82171 RepID=UPI000400EE58|nr:GGDEF domain-containing protein [Maridesulfovibrio zosterae]
MDKLNWLGEFKDPKAEENFQIVKWPSVRARILFLYFFSITAYIIGACSDFYDLGAGPEFHKMVLARVGVCVLGSMAFIMLFVDKVRAKIQYMIMSVCMFSFIMVESLELLMKFSVIGSLSVPATVFLILAYYILLPTRTLPSLSAALCGTLLYLISLSSIIPVASGTFITSTLYLFLANCFGLFFLCSFGKSLRREYAANCDLKRLVEYDDLTGTCSRRRVMEAGKSLFKSSIRFNNKLSVLMMDIDYFKKVNDEYGHSVGDHVLKETAGRCSSVLRDVDFLGRMGGEEFVVILPQSSLYHATIVAERLRRKVCESPCIVDDVQLLVTVSIGVAELRLQKDFSQLLQEADEQLYRAKKCGRNQVCPAQLKVVDSGTKVQLS